MTADEVLLVCSKTIGQPLNRMQTQIGIPRERSTGGPEMRRLAEQIAKHGFEPWFVVNDFQMSALEAELGRVILPSGDILFGIILVTTCDEHEFEWFREHVGKEAVVDCRV